MPRSNNKEVADCYKIRKRREKKKESSFFKIIQPSCLQHGRLVIPNKFVRNYGKKLFGTTVLQVPCKKEWHVEIREEDGRVWFENGLQEFMECHSIRVGHFLVFKYDGYSGFNVVIFDMTTCEIDYPCDTDDDLEEPGNEIGRNKKKQDEDAGNKRKQLVSDRVNRIEHEENVKVGQGTFIFRGVSIRKKMGIKYEARIYDNSTASEGRKCESKLVRLGAYVTREKAAQIRDLAALKYWGSNAKLNFPISNYEKQLEEMSSMSREEYVNFLRRNNTRLTRGCSMYRGVTRSKNKQRWSACIRGRVAGSNQKTRLGTYDTAVEAAKAYDVAAVKLHGMNAITNFDIRTYYKEGSKELDVEFPLPKRMLAHSKALKRRRVLT